MCLGECPVYDKDHVSASWIQSEITGFRVISEVLVDPNVLEEKCSYPLDGNTEMRSQHRCGSMFPTSKLDKWWTKREILYPRSETDLVGEHGGKIFNVRKHDRSADFTWYPWLTCSSKHCEEMIQEEAPLQIQTWNQWKMQWESSLLGHAVCNGTLHPPDWHNDYGDPVYLMYAGDKSWLPQDWQHMVNIQRSLIQEHPDAILWNEMVLNKPSSLQVLQAVFYIYEEQRDEAQSEGKRLSLPVMKVRREDRDIFQCDVQFIAEE